MLALCLYSYLNTLSSLTSNLFIYFSSLIL